MLELLMVARWWLVIKSEPLVRRMKLFGSCCDFKNKTYKTQTKTKYATMVIHNPESLGRREILSLARN
jgi:hypothetical protein